MKTKVYFHHSDSPRYVRDTVLGLSVNTIGLVRGDIKLDATHNLNANETAFVIISQRGVLNPHSLVICSQGIFFDDERMMSGEDIEILRQTKQDKTDNALSTTAKNIVGAINELWKGGLKDASIGTPKIEDKAVTKDKLADAVVASLNKADTAMQSIPAGSVNTAMLADYAVTTDKIGVEAVTNDKIAYKSITGNKIANDSISFSHISDNSINNSKIINSAIYEEKLSRELRDKIGAATNYTIELTYAELKNKRAAKKLVPGQTYRITDFVTTTTQTDTRSAGHPFDIIVVADDAGTLNENAHACLHDGDTYFADCKLEAWELKYCLDNDTTRFAWADTTNGKGVVWWMKDEWNNECFYDFKNIQYKRWKVTGATEPKYQTRIASFVFSDFQPYFYGIKNDNTGDIYPVAAVIDETAFDWFYTFAARVDAEYLDASLKEHLTEEEKIQVSEFGASDKSVVSDCVIGKNIHNLSDAHYPSDTLVLNNAVVYNEITIELSGGAVSNVIGGYSYGILCGDNCTYWTCGNLCNYWTCGNLCSYWSCGNNCSNWSCGNNCHYWSCGNDCESWACGNNCFGWSCGNNCSNWSCGNDCTVWSCGDDCCSWSCGNGCIAWSCGNNCTYWTCGNNCESWTCGDDCYNWTCGSGCGSWTCGGSCYYWSCGNNCHSWTCGNDCYNWSCGNNCHDWSCGNGCTVWSCGDTCYNWTCGNNCESWTCGNDCYNWTCGEVTSGTKVLQNYVSFFHLDSGVSNITIKSSGTPTSSAPLKNFKVKAGVKGASSSNKLAIVIDAASFPLNSSYEWTIAKNSSGVIKQYCEADLIN